MKDKNSKKGKNQNRPINLELTEIFMAKAGWSRCFHGTIKREKDEEGVEIAVWGKIKIHNGHIWSRAENQFILGEKLDEMVFLVLDYDLNSKAPVTIEVANAPLNYN